MKVLTNTRTLEMWLIDVGDVSRYHDMSSLKKLGFTVPCNELDRFTIYAQCEFTMQRNLSKLPRVIEVL
ncbi:hypothetical protein [Vibrio splendidus]|uniref:hypothetical protein n=1 Tax=Vibrio splendidus TaxID=29497 RepID=UPI0006376326|nr:hypothetical protein [Vibrio splendidus]OCH61890.1 hypothetical protein A6D94_17095 [Vibrio splendidus]CDT47762.1 hypothetical protein VCR6J2_470079 [Vibrio coralliirubri]